MACEQEIERAIHAEGQVLLGWRDVPTDNAGLSERTKEVEPVIRQVFIARGSTRHGPGRARAQALHHPQAVRATRSRRCSCRHGKEFYVPSMSTRTIVYKGMLLAHQVGEYYVDLHDRIDGRRRWRWCTSASRPTRSRPWDLAHPFRFVCHNGEINTLRGNFNWIRARAAGASPARSSRR